MVFKKPTGKSLPEMPFSTDQPATQSAQQEAGQVNTKAIQTLGAEWFMGFFECKGNFGATVTERSSGKVQVVPYVELIVDTEDRHLLDRLQQFFGCGHIGPLKTRQQNPAKESSVDSRYRWRVTRLKDLQNKVVPFFEQLPWAIQRQAWAFEVFREVCILVQQRQHWHEEGLQTIQQRIDELKACRYRAPSKLQLLRQTLGVPMLPYTSMLNQKNLTTDRLLGIFAVHGVFRAQITANPKGSSKKDPHTNVAAVAGSPKAKSVQLSVLVSCNGRNQEVLRQFQKLWSQFQSPFGEGGVKEDPQAVQSFGVIQKRAQRQVVLPFDSKPCVQSSGALTVKDPEQVKKVMAFFKCHGLVTHVQQNDFKVFCELADRFLMADPPCEADANEQIKWQEHLCQMQGYRKYFRVFVASESTRFQNRKIPIRKHLPIF